MASPHLKELIRIAREDMVGIQYDLQNASHPLALRPVCERMFEIMGLLLHHVVIESVENTMQNLPMPTPPAPAPAPVIPVVVPRPARPATAIDVLGLPPPPSMTQPAPAVSAVPGMPSAQAQPGVTNVFLTTQGTQVVAPSGAKTMLPAGSAIDLAASAGTPPELPPAPPGVAQVVLPPGGGITPEIEAALAGRSNPV